MMLTEIPHIDDSLTARETLDLEVVRVAIDEQEPGRSAAAVRLELMAFHRDDRMSRVRRALTAPSGHNIGGVFGCCVSPTARSAARDVEDR